MTRMLFRENPYRSEAPARVAGHTQEGGIVLDATLFYPTGGGQPGDSGRLIWAGGEIGIATTIKAGNDAIALVPAEAAALPPVGAEVAQCLDWERRHAHMRMHTALHLLSAVVALPVTGGSVGAGRGRLDFDMAEAPADRPALEARLNALIDRDFTVTEHWIDEDELDADPGLVRTLSVRPPRGAGRIRLIGIGAGTDRVDLQPCGGTHVARTAEIGRLRLGRIEKKGRRNRRITLHLDA
ncbi:MAG: alanyl-tRNA editing protein [Roseovarius sp.]|nr:alanyl-tRNA editing protein [Roseovarius sp.]